MSMPVTFALVTLFFAFAQMAALWLFQRMIARDGLLDQLFGWQKMLDNLYGGKKWQQLLGKALGECEMCTAFWFQFPWYALYFGFCKVGIGFFVTDWADNWVAKIFLFLAWMIPFNSVNAITGMMSMIRAKRKMSNNVPV